MCPAIGYATVSNIDIGNFDIAQIANINSACDCGVQCQLNVNCEFFVFGTDVNTCWLKQTTKTNQNRFTYFPFGINSFQGDVANFDLPNQPTIQPNQTACEYSCTNNISCNWANYQINADGTTTCWLKQATQNIKNRVVGFPASFAPGHLVLTGSDIPFFDLTNMPYTSLGNCAAACDANPQCGWWNVNGNTCYLKQADQTKPDFYTWFIGSQGAIPGDIPNFDISNAAAYSPQECYNRCRTTAGCQWVNYQDLGYGQGVHCWLKKANGVAGASTGVASSSAIVQNACAGEGDYISIPGYDIGAPAFDLQRIDNVVSPCECAQYCEANDAC
ncbi:hypothetical protein HDU76_010522, partial [Blyttiomyces sp. JEL0837]